MDNRPAGDFMDMIKSEEDNAVPWDSKWFGIRSLVKTTKELSAEVTRDIPFSGEWVIKRDRTLEAVGMFGFALCLTGLMAYIINRDKINFTEVAVTVLILGFMYFIFYKNLTLKSINFDIVLTSQGIRLGEDHFLWGEIKETFIIYRPVGKLYHYYLLVLLKNADFKRYDINTLISFTRRPKHIAFGIEHFKKGY
jgi:hypothetical protein